jgi:hypothetical protein
VSGSPNNEASARRRNVGKRGWDDTERGKRRRLYALRTWAFACLAARVRERDVWRTRAHVGAKTIAGGQNGDGDAATSSQTEKRDGRLASCVRGAVGCGTCRKASHHGTKAVLHTAASAVARGNGEIPNTNLHPQLEGRAS